MRRVSAPRPSVPVLAFVMAVLLGLAALATGCAAQTPKLQEHVTKYMALIDQFGILSTEFQDGKIDGGRFAISSGQIRGELSMATEEVEETRREYSREDREKVDAVLDGMELANEGVELIVEGRINKKQASILEGELKVHRGVQTITKTGLASAAEE